MNDLNDMFDRRSSARVRTRQPIEVHCNGAIIHGELTSTSERGISFHTQEPVTQRDGVLVLIKIPEQQNAVQISGSIVWRQERKDASGYEYGLHIEEMPAIAKKIISSWMAETLLVPGAFSDRRSIRTIQSKLVNFQNRRGKNLVSFVDSLIDGLDKDAPMIVVCPGFGETKTNALSISYYLVKNGFRVLRYDAADHIGESDGNIYDCTLSKLTEDVIASIDFIEKEYGNSRVGLIATSLASLAVLKAASLDRRIAFVGGLVPVVNLQHTLNAVYSEDLVGEFLTGRKWGSIDIMGFPIDADQFLTDSVQGGYHSLNSVTSIIKEIRAPIHFIAGSNDPWVLIEDIKEVLETKNKYSRDYSVIPSSMHQLHENPLASKAALQEMVKAALHQLAGRSIQLGDIINPSLREVAVQSRIERERRKLIVSSSKEEDVQFWSSYLNQFSFIMRVPDFRQFFAKMQELITLPADGEVVLDAGCGNGSYGLWLISSLMEQQKDAGKIRVPAFTYIGLDFVSSALKEAQDTHRDAMRMLNENRDISGSMNFIYALGDLDQRLPFMDNYFHKICCNLVLSYVHDPQSTLRELYRVLAPGGRLVVSTLKPYADLSVVYKSFMEKATTSEDILEARKLLTNAGSIRSKETEGQFKFFSETELTGLMLSVGAKDPLVCRSFANQANIVLVIK